MRLNSLIFVLVYCLLHIAEFSNAQKLKTDTENYLSEMEEKLQKLILQVDQDFTLANSTMVGNSRTFGKLRPLRLAVPAIMYKLGVVTTMLGFLTLFAIKGLLVGAIILIIQLSSALAKLHSLKKEEGWETEHHNPHKIPQTIHVHVHGNGHGHSPAHYVYSSHSSSDHHGPPSWSSDHSDEPWSRRTAPAPTPYTYQPNKYANNDYLYDRILDKYKEYKELKELQELRESLYQQVI